MEEQKNTAQNETGNSTPLDTAASSTVSGAATATVTETVAEVVPDVVTETVTAPTETPVAQTSTVPLLPAVTATRKLLIQQYGIAAVIVLIIGCILWYGLERQGRVNTGVFDAVSSFIVPEPAVATVNGKVISMAEFERNKNQLLVSAGQQGIDVTDAAVIAELDQQAIDTLVNTELLRQGAVAAGITVTPEQVEARYQEVVDAVGGGEVLAARMAEIGIDEPGLRRDIEGEILIQSYLAKEIDTTSIVITDEDVNAVYEQAKAVSNNLPPLDSVRAEIESQLRFSKEQELVNAFIETLRTNAKVEIKM